MTQPTVHSDPPGEQVTRRADELVVGDVIAEEFLPHFDNQSGKVLFVKVNEREGRQYVFVAYELTDGWADSTTYLPEKPIRVTPAPPAKVAGHICPYPATCLQSGPHVAPADGRSWTA